MINRTITKRILGKAFLCFGIAGALMLTGCSQGETKAQAGGQAEEAETEAYKKEQAKGAETEEVFDKEQTKGTDAVTDMSADAGIAGETARDAKIDFAALKAENQDIFAWIYLPDTDIDCPVLQSEEADDYYESHNAYGEASEEGAVYTELANLKNMCDFNTVLHGKTAKDGEEGLFAELYNFADPDFFESHETIYLYLDGNLLTYEIFAAYERENTSLIRTYDFTYISGCQQFLDDLYDTRVMGMNIREGWEDITPYHFLITLTTQRGDNADKQFVVIAALVHDAAGTIDRIVLE